MLLAHFRSMTIAARIWAVVVVLLTILIGTNLLQAVERKDALMQEKLLKTRHLVETAASVLSHYYTLQQEGQLGEAEARTAAIEAVRAMRYEGAEYFWLNDFSTPYPKMVMHPTVPALDGLVLDDARFNCATSTRVGIDGPVVKTNGRKNLFVAANAVANQGGQGYVTYDWPKPKAGGGTTEATYPKLSYVKKFSPWGWLIGTGIYVEDVEAAFRQEMWRSTLAVVLPVTVALLVVLTFLRSSLAPLSRLAAAADRIATGDFQARAPEQASDPPELRTIMRAFNSMADSVGTLMRNLEEHQGVLEHLVQERTAELSAANRSLTDEKTAQQTLIRKLEEAQNQLLQSEKLAAIGQLAAGVAHEINNPIGFVNSNLCTLQKYVETLLGVVNAYETALLAPPAEIVAVRQEADLDYLRQDILDLLRESKDGLSRVKKIVQDLKDFSHVDEAQWQETDLNAGLESTLNVVWNELKYKAEVKKEYGQLPQVRCLAAQVNQVFMNLLVNAAQAIDERGTITVRTGVEGDGVWVEVADTGRGMSEAVQRRIFEPFFTTKPVGKGTGLGLSLSYDIIVAKHGGRIAAQSQPGKGSTFRVWLPVAGREEAQ